MRSPQPGAGFPQQADTSEFSDSEAITETSVEARQGFLDRPVLIVLCSSLAAAVLAGIFLWMM